VVVPRCHRRQAAVSGALIALLTVDCVSRWITAWIIGCKVRETLRRSADWVVAEGLVTQPLPGS
jgi:hypothetical protein